MRSIFFLLVLVAAALGQNRSPPRVTDSQIEMVLKNDRLFVRYYNCLMHNQDCNRSATEMKNFIPEAISNNCAQCNQEQKYQIRKVFQYLAAHRPREWNEILQKYDPYNQHADVIRSYLN